MRALNRFLREQVSLPLLIVVVLLLALVSETTYRRAATTLTGGINLTDARIGAANLLQLLTDAETGQRGYLLTGNAAYIEPLRNAQREFNNGLAFVDFMAALGPTGPQDAASIRSTVAARFAELDRTVALAQSGDQTQALALVKTDSGKRLMDELRGVFKIKLGEAALLQQGARDRIYRALMFNRLAVLLLCGLLGWGLYQYRRQQRLLAQTRLHYQQTLERDVAEKTFELRQLAAWLETAREDEKAHLARELHDELGGILTAAKLNLARIRSKVSNNVELLAHIESVSQYLSQGIALKRRIIEDLRPSTLDQLGLQIALENLCRDTARQLAIPVTADIAQVGLASNAELAVYRVVQEALTNIGKYSAATQVRVQVSQTGQQVQVEVTDNGAGFDTTSPRVGQHGLAGMRFRMESHGGLLTVSSAPGLGATILARLPGLASSEPSVAEVA